MLKRFVVSGYGLVKSGCTKGIRYDVRAKNIQHARQVASEKAECEGYSNPRFIRVVLASPLSRQ